MKCMSCGHDLPAKSRFCQYCGSKISRVKWPKSAKITAGILTAVIMLLLGSTLFSVYRLSEYEKIHKQDITLATKVNELVATADECVKVLYEIRDLRHNYDTLYNSTYWYEQYTTKRKRFSEFVLEVQ